MQKNFDYNTVPHKFLHCVNTQCSRADNCLRQQLMAYVTPDRMQIPIVNPVRIPESGENCPEFFADQTKRFAMGVDGLLDDIPHKKCVKIKRELLTYFSRTTFYRIRMKERLISPQEQRFICKVFLENGIKEELVFEEYVEKYEW